MTTKLYQFQKDDVRQIEAWNGRALVANDMGLGKSLTALTYFRRNPQTHPAVVVTFASLKFNWEREAKVHIGVPAEVLEGTKPPRLKRLVNPPQLVIVNYDIVHAWIKYLKRLKPGLIIIDEGQAIKDPRARRTRMVKELCREVPHVVVLSGTPLLSRPMELFTVLNLLRPDLYPARQAFGMAHCGPRLTPWGFKFDGATRIPQLNRRLRRYLMIRRRKIDVLDDLPDKIRQVVPLAIQDRKTYLEAQHNFVRWLRDTQGDAKARRAARAHRLVQMGYLKRLAATSKMQAVFEWLDLALAASSEKRVVFAVHKTILGQLQSRYAKHCVVVDGSVTGRARQRAFDQFLRTKKTRLLIGQVDAAGAGWSAKGVPWVDIVEFGWTPGGMTQAEDRAWGIGRGIDGVPTTVSYLVAHGTIEEKLLKILQSKQRVLSQTLDGDARGDVLNVHDLLERALLEREADVTFSP